MRMSQHREASGARDFDLVRLGLGVCDPPTIFKRIVASAKVGAYSSRAPAMRRRYFRTFVLGRELAR